MNVDKKKAAQLIGKGLSNTTIAKILNCTEAYIIQLKEDPTLQEAIQKIAARELENQELATPRLVSMRSRLLQKLDDAVDYMHKPMEIIKVLETVEKSLTSEKEREALGAKKNQNVNNVVQLVLPATHNFSFTLSTNREVIEVDGRTLQSMSSANIFKELEGQNGEQNGSTTKQLASPNPASQANFSNKQIAESLEVLNAEAAEQLKQAV